MITVAESALRPLVAGVRRAAVIPVCRAAWRWLRGMFPVRATRPAPAPLPSRQLRPVIVPDSLDDLKGPKSGVVELPITLFWSRPDRRFDIGDRCQALDMYLAVLDAAWDLGDLATYLNGELLAELWPDLHLTRMKRRPWETRFEALRSAAAAAA